MSTKIYKKGPASLPSILNSYMRESLKEYDYVYRQLLIEWVHIVGPTLGRVTAPSKVARNHTRKGEHTVLHLFLYESSMAIQLQYQEHIILEKIALFFGYKAIHSLHIVHAPRSCEKREEEKHLAAKPLSSEQERALSRQLAPISDESIRFMLQKLGRHILD